MTLDSCGMLWYVLFNILVCCFFFFFSPREKDLNAKFIISMEKNKTTITNLKVSKHNL